MKKTLSFFTIVVITLFLAITFSSCNYFSNKKYKEAIAKADSYFENREYTDAKTYYVEAQEIKPDDKYPKQRINDIEQILKTQKTNALYKKELQAADKLFDSKNYNDAKTKYLKASELKPKEQHPIDMVGEIDKLLAEIKKQEEFLNNPYHIVVGCFTVKSNATRLNDKLLAEGYKSRILSKTNSQFNVVTINSYPSNNVAYNNLNDIRSNVAEEAWVYKY